MRLIKCKMLQLEEFSVADIPLYAILLHKWGKLDEVTFEDLSLNRPVLKIRAGFRKIKYALRERKP
jgi:hypothetical protein